ncbi:Flp pilus assembly protein TadD [Shewanella psychrophila]|uniref:Flp pilus assembly protein TadD n=1 Tax=Shewanella psychrophila TaxID=225848 RepID=A0A1S6HPI1_9GAMM|nr:tetratricopeptide repeat protein [Shewanella psychrophila]AQS37435.1 Flp pilus assembly protein TadD [Shewanella psychrophila]
MKRLIFIFLLTQLMACGSSGSLSAEQITANDRHLAEVAMTNGSPESAIEIYQSLLVKAPQDVELLYLLGSAYNLSGEYEMAIHQLTKASRINHEAGYGSRGEILRETGRARLAYGDTHKALTELQQASSLLPEDAVTHNSLGVCYALHQDYQQARHVFQAALNIDPGSLEYRNNLALAWILDDKPQRGIDVIYPTYLRGKSTPKLRQNLALAFAMKGDMESAKAIARQDLTKAELERNIDFYGQWQGKGL